MIPTQILFLGAVVEIVAGIGLGTMLTIWGYRKGGLKDKVTFSFIKWN